MTCARCSRGIEDDSAFCRYCGAPVHHEAPKRLVRLPGEGKVAGVCAGIAARFDTDVALIRLAWVILAIVPGALIGGAIAYVAAWILMPAAEKTARSSYAGRRLLRSESDRKIAGICGGLADYLGIDSTVVRVVAVVLAIYPGAVVLGVLAYLIAWFIIPPAPILPMHEAPSRA